MADRAVKWILMRGLTRECRHWGGFTEILAQSLPGCDIHCVDLPGNGALNNESSPDEISVITDRVRAGVDERFGEGCDIYLLGLSMGGMVACDWALRHPEEVRGLVVINSSLAEFSPVWQRIRWQAWWRVLGAFLVPSEQREQLIYQLTCNVRDDHESTLQQWLRYQRENPVRRRNFLYQLKAAADYKLPACDNVLTRDALILASAGDRLVDPVCSSHLAFAFGAQVQLHPDAGHDLTHDDPLWVVGQISSWLGQTYEARQLLAAHR